MAAYLKTRMYSLMGTTSGVTETERTYNTVNVNGYTEMNYTCYAKTRKTTLSTTVVYGGSEKQYLSLRYVIQVLISNIRR